MPAVEVHDKAGRLVVAADAHVGGHRKRGDALGQGCARDGAALGGKRRRAASNDAVPAAASAAAMASLRSVTNPTLSAWFYSIRGWFG